MQLDKDTVERVAALARLSFSDAEKVKMMDELSKIVTFCEKLNELNTDGIEPLIYVHQAEASLRDGTPVEPLQKADALKNAPQHDSDYFKVPKVIERA